MEFYNADAFVAQLKTAVIPSDAQNVYDFTNLLRVQSLFDNLNNGCKCTRHVRGDTFNNHYLGLLPTLTDIEKNWLKEKFGVPVIAKNGNQEVWRIE